MLERSGENSPLSTEWDQVCELHSLDQKRVLDLGCGSAELTLRLAREHPSATVMGIDVDSIQIERHQANEQPDNVTFGWGGAEKIPAPDQSLDHVFMFKSLHHVPEALIPTALDEVHRVLKTGGVAHFSEPVFLGEYSDLLRLVHDESRVRARAFEAIRAAVGKQRFELITERFYRAAIHFSDFEDFSRRVIDVTHTKRELSREALAQVRHHFERRVGEESDGVRLLAPQRIDVLKKQ